MNTRIKITLVALFIVLTIILLSGWGANSREENWNKTITKVSSGVVSIKTDVPMSFDGKWNRSSYATGFVVDAENGIILTNRHVISPGPITAKATLVNNEEIDLIPLYFDPVHDFGFFKYDPSQIEYITPHEFKLSSKKPEVGESIRIIGNDAGQKISILDGTISRLDRDAPLYGKGKYNDFNTFYIQAATSSSGGSSGSPVINIKGEAVALNAGSQTDSATAYYLPLDKIEIALAKLQANQSIARGTLKSTFISTPYAELSRLGLSDELEASYRKNYPDLKGLLVVRHIIPESNAAKHLLIGDILLTLNEKSIGTFFELEQALNKHVGQDITLQVARAGEVLSFTIRVDDLHELSPQSIVNFDGSIFHTLSYQQARHFNTPITGVYVALSGGAFSKAGVPSKSVLTEFNGEKIETVEALNNQLLALENGKKINLRYIEMSAPTTSNYGLVEINRRWFEHSYCQKSTELPYWPCEKFTDNPKLAIEQDNSETQVSVVDSNNLEDSLVNVSFTSPYAVQGRGGDKNRYGTGVIVDIEKGWVVVARSIVFSMLGDVKITFNNRYEVNGKVEYIHPLHNLALVSYSPTELGQVKVSQVKLSDTPMQKGDAIVQLGLNYDGEVEYRLTDVDTTEELWLKEYNVPQFVDKNIESTSFVNPSTSIDGILVNTKDEVAGLWFLFEESDQNGSDISNVLAGISAHYVKDMVDHLTQNKPIYTLDINLTMLPPVNALNMGLDETWLNKLQQANANEQKLLAIYNVSGSSSSASYLKRGDIILEINDMPVTTFRQLEALTQHPEVKVTYFSEGKVNTTNIETTPLYGVDIDRVLYWSGLYLHAPHRAAQLQGNINAEGVYIASYTYGSPATHYGVYAMQRIIEIDGKAIASTDDFINAVKGKPHNDTVVIKTIDFSSNTKVITLKVNNHYWPFYEIKYADGQWQRIDHSVLNEKL